jgi:hypothetical protein
MVMPNYTPPGWWEADVWAMYASGTATEFEIKVTAADFRNDFKKVPHYRSCRTAGKHARLQLGDTAGPNRFFFVLPAPVFEKVKDEIPEYAGVLTVANPNVPVLQEAKKACWLHREKREHDIRRLRISCYYRMWQLKQRNLTRSDLKETDYRRIQEMPRPELERLALDLLSRDLTSEPVTC